MSSRLQLLNAAIVVLAEGHNPTILHPSFLRSQGIVPAEWELAEDPLCTPAIAVVKYANGIVFTVETTKFQVLSNTLADPPERTAIPEFAAKYVAALPHVRYKAVGLNFTGSMPCPDPKGELVRKFLKDGEWNSGGCLPEAFGLRLVYPMQPGLFRLSFEGGFVKQGPTETPAVIATANYHTDLQEDDVQQTIGLFGERCSHFIEIVEKFLR